MKFMGTIALSLAIEQTMNNIHPGAMQTEELFLMAFGILLIVLKE